MKKILIIEDEKILREVLAKNLRKEGFEVLEAIDAKEAFEKLKEEKVDLILLDLILPGMSGFDFLTKIKSEKEWMEIPVIVLSNLGQDEEIERGLKLGAIDYLVKANFSLSQIVERIKEILKP